MLRSRRGIVLLSCLLATADALAKWNVALNLGREPGSRCPRAGRRAARASSCRRRSSSATILPRSLRRSSAAAARRAASLRNGVVPQFGGRREVAVGRRGLLARDRAPAVLRFWLDFSGATDVESRGVALPAEKLYFTASAFDADDVAARGATSCRRIRNGRGSVGGRRGPRGPEPVRAREKNGRPRRGAVGRRKGRGAPAEGAGPERGRAPGRGPPVR